MADNLMSFSLDGLRHTLKTSKDSKLIGAIDDVATAAILLSPLALGPAAGLSALALLEAKGEMKRLAERGIDAVRSANTVITDRNTLLSAVYCMSCYTAFFEAIDSQLTRIRREFKLSKTERLQLTERALLEIQSSSDQPIANDDPLVTKHSLVPLTYNIEIPHPTSTLLESSRQLRLLYGTLSEGFTRFVTGLSAWEVAEEHVKDRIRAHLQDLPRVAQRKYREQYLGLCTEFEEFSIWAMLNEHELTRTAGKASSVEIQAAIRTLSISADRVDLGLAGVEQTLATLQKAMPTRPELAALRDLDLVYESRINEPVIVDEMSGSESDDLVYPQKTQIFVPQSCRALLYRRGMGSLEHPNAWQGTSRHQSITGLLLATLNNPRSRRSPVLMLGHPGSGKSLLTEMLASRLTSSIYTPIRVELRDINADAPIQTQIEEQIFRDTGHRVSWTTLAEHCTERPPLIILDGYDELLQATGRVHSTYLTQVSTFQQREELLNRNLRVIVTSRITLIDRAEVPEHSTVIRLDDFDEPRKNAWIETWNAANASYFASKGLSKFSLTTNRALSDLSDQPLLLFMLALYDSEANALRSDKGLNQTILYHNLLVRFIDREHRKGEDGARYAALDSQEKQVLVELDLRRLGVAAIGMFNRRALHISRPELESDIAFFDIERIDGHAPSGVNLGQADLLLGSFFFVHESRSRVHNLAESPSQSSTAFEFLHNTFGEFLAADFILRDVSEECRKLRILSSDRAMLADRIKAGIPESLLASLIFAPLFTRPVVLRMFSEWARSWTDTAGVGAQDYGAELADLVNAQLRSLTQGASISPILLGQTQHPYPRHGFLYHLSVLTLNLVLLRTFLTGAFTLDLSSEPEGLQWGKVHPLWRAAFGLGGMEALGSLIESRFGDGGITFKVADEDRPFNSTSLQSVYLTARSIGDDVLQALAGWALQDTSDYPDLAHIEALPSTETLYELEELVNARQLEREIAKSGVTWVEHDELTSLRTRLMSCDFLSYSDYRKLIDLPRHFGTQRHIVGAPEMPNVIIAPSSLADLPKREVVELMSEGGVAVANALYRDRMWKRQNRTRDILRKEVNLLKWIVHQPARGVVVPGEVVLEAVLGIPHADLAEVTEDIDTALRSRVGPLTLATRPMTTFRELLTLSKELTLTDWLDGTLRKLTQTTEGPPLAQVLGMFRVLALLNAFLESGSDLPEDISRKLHGIAAFLLRNCECESPFEVLAMFLSVHRRIPSWMADAPTIEFLFTNLLIPRDAPIGGYLPSAAIEDLRWYEANLVKTPRQRARTHRSKIR